MIRPTPRAALLFTVSVPLALVIVVSSLRPFWYVSLYFPFTVFVLIAIDAMAILPGRRLHIGVGVPNRLYLGHTGVASLHIEGDGCVRALPMQALLELSGDADPSSPVSGVMTDGRLDLQLFFKPHKRGLLAVDAIWLRWQGPYGLVEAQRREVVGDTVEVVPDVKGIHEAALQFFSRDAVYGVKTQRLKGEGTEFESLCEYAPGMDSRLIDWKRSAHHRKLLCKEFRQERNHQIVMGFDTSHLMLEPIGGIPKLDHAIKAALLLGWISLYSGDLIGGCAFDMHFRNFLKPGRGMHYFTQSQRFTSALDYRTEETNFTLGLAELNSRLQRRALVVLFTEFVDSISAELLIESLQLMSRKHVVVFVAMRDPMLSAMQGAFPDSFASVAKAVIADDMLRERLIVLERIARLGVHCLDVSAQAVSTSLLNRYLMIKQRGLL